jgi:hypothetical protein
MLFKKGLIKQAEKQLNSAKKLAEKHHKNRQLLQIFDCNMDQWNRNDIAQFALKYLDSQGKDPAIEQVESDLNIGFGF